MEFKIRIREMREEKGLSASQLAAAFDKSEGAIRMWEAGKTKPDADTLVKLARYFGVTSDYLLGLTDARNPENVALVGELGLSEKSLQHIRQMADLNLQENCPSDPRTYLDILNHLLEDENFYLGFVSMMGDMSNEYAQKIDPKLLGHFFSQGFLNEDDSSLEEKKDILQKSMMQTMLTTFIERIVDSLKADYRKED